MTKDAFLGELTHRLGYLPYEEVKKSVDFYREAIDDRMEDGLSEEEAVAAMGDIDSVVHEFEQTLPLSVIVKKKVKTERKKAEERSGNKTLWIVLAALGSVVWVPLLIAAAAVIFAFYIVVWALAFSVAAVAAALAVSGGVLAVSALFLPYPGFAPRLMLCGVGLFVLGLGLLFVPAAKSVGKAMFQLTRAFGRWVKRLILGKKEAS